MDINNYNKFSREYIKRKDGTDSKTGWVNGNTDIENSSYTPLNAANLNTMLKMLIDIRDVLGRTDADGLQNIKITDTNGSVSALEAIDKLIATINGNISDLNTTIKTHTETLGKIDATINDLKTIKYLK